MSNAAVSPESIAFILSMSRCACGVKCVTYPEGQP